MRFVAQNVGTISHQLALSAPNAQTSTLLPGETASIDVVFAGPGSIALFCPIANVPLLPGTSHRQRGMEASFAVAQVPAGVTVGPTPTVEPAPAKDLTAPGSTVDRVGLPADFTRALSAFYVFDRSDNRQVRHIFANAAAAAVRAGQPYPYGSVLVMETWRAKLTPDNQIQLDANGRYIKDELTGIFVMRKERGFGEKYGPDRNGEWEYVAFQPDGSTYSTTPQRSQGCAQCHFAVSDAQKDWVVRANLFFANRQNVLAGIVGLPRTGGHAIAVAASGSGLTTLGLAALGPALAIAGIAIRSIVRRR